MNILVIDIGGTSIKVGISDGKGNIRNYKEFDTESKKGGKHLVAKLIEIIKSYKGFEYIGISTAGQVNSEEGYIVYANENIPNYTGTRLKEIIEKEFNCPVKVENDVNCAALGEKYFGAAMGKKDFLCLTYGTGIGGAIIIDSKIYKGHNGVAAEFGHILTHSVGKNNHGGYYEAYGSTRALVKRAKEICSTNINGRIILEKIKQGDQELKAILEDWAQEVALGVSSLIHIFNPSIIILGGGIMEQDMVIEMVTKKVEKLIMKSFKEVKINKASLGNKAGLLGASSLFL